MPVFCAKCGIENRSKSKFCRSCGNGLSISLSSVPLAVGTVLENRYKIINQVVSGDISAVYKAKVLKLNSICAVKELIPTEEKLYERAQAVEWFKREAKLLARLDNPNLPRVFDYFVSGGRYYLIMNYIEGEDLLDILEKRGNPGLPEHVVIDWATQILKVLDYLHNLNPPVVYRDVKPENIMLHRDGRIILIDFGIARVVRKEDMESPKTVIGTDGYAPLEQYHGKPEPRSDIYALGATMHHLLTGIVPAPLGIDPIRDLMPSISPRLERIITKALREKPEDRFASAREMLEALELKEKIDFTINFAELYRDMLFGQGLRDVYFVDSETGWIVGDNGVILHTEDEGNKWEKQNSGTFCKFHSLYFVDESTGWVVGDNGIILYTTSGGETWKIQKSPVEANLYGVHFVDENLGWIVGDNGIILHTTSGGEGGSWFNIKGGGEGWKIQDSKTLSKLYSLYFIDENCGWAAGDNGIIISTTDGGETWEEKRNGKTLMAIDFADEKHGWAVGDNGTILKTSDGGKSWISQSSQETSNHLVDVYFIDEKNGWVVGGNLETGETILHTTDGGRTWINRNTGIAKPFASVNFVNFTTGWIVGYNGSILYTNNGGVTWTAQNSRGMEDLIESTMHIADGSYITKRF